MLRSILLAFLLCWLFNCSSYGQDIIEADTVLANRYYAIADSLRNNSYYDEAINFIKKAKNIYLKCNLPIEVSELECGHIRNLVSMGKMQLALEKLDLLQQYVKSNIGENSLQAGQVTFLRSNIYLKIKKPSLAVKNYNLSLNIYQKNDSLTSKKWINLIYRDLSSCHKLLGNYDLALNYNSKINAQAFGKEYHVPMAKVFYNNSIIYEHLGEDQKAMQYLMKGIAVLNDQKIDKSRMPVYGSLLQGIGRVKMSNGEYDVAMDFLFQSLNHIMGIYGMHHRRLVPAYGNLAILFRRVGNYDSSMYYYKKTLSEQNIHYKNLTVGLSITYNGLALNYIKKKNYDQAIKFQKRAIDILTDMNFGGLELSKDISQLGSMYAEKKDFERASNYFRASIKQYTLNFEKVPPVVSKPYTSLAMIKSKEKDYVSALVYLQSALSHNVDSFEYKSIYDHPPRKNYRNQLLYLDALTIRAETFKLKFIAEGISKDLISCVKTYELCDLILNDIRFSYQSYNDKIKLQSKFSLIYEGAISTSLLAYLKFGEEQYLEKCLYYLEKSKASVLTGALSDNRAKKISGIPDNLLSFEKSTKGSLSFYKNGLNIERGKKGIKDTLRIEVYGKKIFQLNNQYDSLIEVFETDYPQYYRMKYENKVVELDDLQQKLPANTALIEYFEGDSTLYVITVTKDDFKVTTIENTNMINQNIDQLRAAISSPLGLEQSDSTYSKYVVPAYGLYNSLVKSSLDSLPANIDNLIIIPDGKLSYIPFELLISDSTSSYDYSSLEYLIKDYNISYAYSATLQYQDKHGGISKKAENNYLGFAPSYADTETDSTRLLALGKFRDAATSLVWNQKEVEVATEYMNGDNWLAMNATETSFKKEVGNYNIVHLAMHAFIDDEDPMLSKLVFAQNEKDTLNDGFLHTYELFNMEMNPDLVVLSACNTGYGKLEKGEGINSLAYAFAYAGCPSIVMSQWQVNDKSTSELMINFYKNISEGMDKSSALRQAKLEFLKEPGSPYSNPAFWGGFVLIGDTQPIDLDEHSYKKILAFSFLGLMIVLAALYVKSKRN